MAYGPYNAIGDRLGFSYNTIRAAFARKAITYATALKIANALKIPVESFRIKVDNRGCKKNANQLKQKREELREKYE